MWRYGIGILCRRSQVWDQPDPLPSCLTKSKDFKHPGNTRSPLWFEPHIKLRIPAARYHFHYHISRVLPSAKMWIPTSWQTRRGRNSYGPNPEAYEYGNEKCYSLYPHILSALMGTYLKWKRPYGEINKIGHSPVMYYNCLHYEQFSRYHCQPWDSWDQV
jgi:hypothetical protein